MGHKRICKRLRAMYEEKDTKYGGAFQTARHAFPDAIRMRISDKYHRLMNIKNDDAALVDTLMDMANYCIMELIALDGESDVDGGSNLLGELEEDFEELLDVKGYANKHATELRIWKLLRYLGRNGCNAEGSRRLQDVLIGAMNDTYCMYDDAYAVVKRMHDRIRGKGGLWGSVKSQFNMLKADLLLLSLEIEDVKCVGSVKYALNDVERHARCNNAVGMLQEMQNAVVALYEVEKSEKKYASSLATSIIRQIRAMHDVVSCLDGHGSVLIAKCKDEFRHLANVESVAFDCVSYLGIVEDCLKAGNYPKAKEYADKACELLKPWPQAADIAFAIKREFNG